MTTRNLVTLVWRTDLLTEAVARRDLSEREQFLLTLFGQIVLFVASYIALFSGIARDWISAAQARSRPMAEITGRILLAGFLSYPFLSPSS
jgi:hypothetical protein